jgi:hypothetical protein
MALLKIGSFSENVRAFCGARHREESVVGCSTYLVGQRQQPVMRL